MKIWTFFITEMWLFVCTDSKYLPGQTVWKCLFIALFKQLWHLSPFYDNRLSTACQCGCLEPAINTFASLDVVGQHVMRPSSCRAEPDPEAADRRPERAPAACLPTWHTLSVPQTDKKPRSIQPLTLWSDYCAHTMTHTQKLVRSDSVCVWT